MTEQRKVRENEWTRAQIVGAASPVFAQKGYHGATMDEIARSAGYSPAALYRYFKSKEEIFEAMIDEARTRMIDSVDDEPPMELDFEGRLRWVHWKQCRVAEEHRDLLLMFMMQRAAVECDPKSALQQKTHRFFAEYRKRVATLMQKAIDDGVLRSGDADDYASAFTGLARGFYFRWLLSETPYPLSDHTEVIVDLFLNGAAAARSVDRVKERAHG